MMRKSTILLFAFVGVLCLGSQAPAAFPGLIDQQAATAHGLTRAWYNQVEMDGARGRVLHLGLADGTLFVQTDSAVLHALDAETGQTLWVEQVGSAQHPTMPAGANSDYVAVVNGSTLYVLNRFNGNLLWKRALEHVPGSGAAMSDRYAYVPMVNGLVVAYRLQPGKDPVAELRKKQNVQLTEEQQKSAEAERREKLRISQERIPPLACTSYGKALITPLVTQQGALIENVVWTTDRGLLFVGQLDSEGERFAANYRLETHGPITSQPAYLSPDANVVGDSGVIYGASEDGFVYAVRETDGQLLWRFSTGDPIIERAVVIGLRVYVPTQTEGMFCLDAKTGQEVWSTPGIHRFLSASKDRIYTADKIGRVIVLSAPTGARIDTLQLSQLPIQMTNDRTDRLYVADPTGLVQCLHEIELSRPLFHREAIAAQQKKAAEAKAPEAGKEGAEAPAAEKPAAENPFGAAKKEDQDNPFGGAKPAAPQENPFDGAAKPAEGGAKKAE
ncbi:MAG: PQQ-binding-like beta-propeller repeat protein [Pirellulales bacterium]|nr:PQQ-binding-like beta-propeller repeat protein [Pirellulales bacterium]